MASAADIAGDVATPREVLREDDRPRLKAARRRPRLDLHYTVEIDDELAPRREVTRRLIVRGCRAEKQALDRKLPGERGNSEIWNLKLRERRG